MKGSICYHLSRKLVPPGADSVFLRADDGSSAGGIGNKVD